MIDKFKNKFIVFEGADSSGKSSTCDLFVKYLIDNGIDTVKTFQPGDPQHGPLAPLFRSLCKDKRHNLSWYGNLFSFLLDRAEDVDKVIRPALKNGKTVVCDRYTYSTVAYQLYGKGIKDEIISTHGKKVADALSIWFKHPYSDAIPDIVYYFPEKIGNRVNDKNDNFDDAGTEFERKVKDAYSVMAAEFDWRIVTPGCSVQENLINLLTL